MTSPKNATSDRRTNTTQQKSSDLDTAITELHQTIIRLNHVIEQVKTMPAAAKADSASQTVTSSQSKPLTLLSLVIPKILH